MRELETLNQSSAKGGEDLKTSVPAHLTPRQHSKLIKFVGRRYIVSCLLQGKKADALWDTGAQVSIILKSWNDAYLPDEPLRELLGERELDLQVANGTAFLYDSWIEVEFQLLGEYGQSEPITVPILVDRQDKTAFLCLSEVTAMSFVNFMQPKEKESDTGVIRVGISKSHLNPRWLL